MTDKLLELEKQLDNYGVGTNLDEDTLLLFPENFRKIHSYRLFGSDLLAIPADEGDEMEQTFSFLSSKDSLNLFDSEFRTEQMDDFIQIGNVFGSSKIVLLNKVKNTVHIFYHSAISCDIESLTYNVENGVGSLEEFIQSLRPQTVCCFANRKSYYPEYNVFEIRDNFELLNDGEIIKYSDEKTVWEEYFKLVDNAVDKGLEVHYAPQKIIERLG